MKLPIHVAFGILVAASAGCAQALAASKQEAVTWAAVVNTAPHEAQAARARFRLAQFCVPSDEDFDDPRVYCGSEPG